MLERITDMDTDSSDYKYQYDAIPINLKKKPITSKYVNVSGSYDEGHAKEGLGDTYEAATRFTH